MAGLRSAVGTAHTQAVEVCATIQWSARGFNMPVAAGLMRPVVSAFADATGRLVHPVATGPAPTDTAGLFESWLRVCAIRPGEPDLLGKLVAGQTEQINTISSAIENTVEQTVRAREELQLASRSKSRLRSRICCLMLGSIIAGLLLVIVMNVHW